MKITAPVHEVMETQTFDSGFQKRILVLKTTGDYPQTLPFEFVKDKVSLLDDLTVGQVVTVDYDIRGNEYNGRYYVNLSAWRIDKTESVNDVTANAARAEVKGSDDLPF